MNQSTMLVKAEILCVRVQSTGCCRGSCGSSVPTATVAITSSRAAAQGWHSQGKLKVLSRKCQMFYAKQPCLQAGASRVAVHCSLTADTHLLGQQISALH